MEIWIIIGLPIAGIVFLLDYLLRRKKWKENTKGEKASLIVNMVSVVPYMIFSAFGMLMGIVGYGAETAFGIALTDIMLVMGGIFFIIAAVAVIGTFILRKFGKIKASIWINVIALAYIVLVLSINTLAGKVF